MGCFQWSFKEVINMNTWWDTDRLSHEQTAKMLGIKMGSLSSGISRGLYCFKRYKVGRRYWYRKSEVLASIEKNHAT